VAAKIATKIQLCGSGKFIPDYDFYLCRIPEPTTLKEE
jgi:hypothetical protein